MDFNEELNIFKQEMMVEVEKMFSIPVTDKDKQTIKPLYESSLKPILDIYGKDEYNRLVKKFNLTECFGIKEIP
jgi:hypothetical protein